MGELLKRRAMIQKNRSLMSLPNGFSELKYLESSGHQSIDTGFIPALTNADDWETEFSFTKSNGVQFLCGTDGFQIASEKYFQVPSVYGKLRVDFCTGGVATSYAGNITINVWITLLCKNMIATVTGLGSEPWSKEIDSRTGNTNKNLILFAQAETGGGGSVRIKSLNWIRNGEYALYLVPALNNQGKPGMFDCVSGSFLTNKWQGEFGYETEDGTYVSPT